MKLLRGLIKFSLIAVLLMGCRKAELLCRKEMVKSGVAIDDAVVICDPQAEVHKTWKSPSCPEPDSGSDVKNPEKKTCCVCK